MICTEEELAELARHLVKSFGGSQKVAALLGLSRQTVSYAVNGRSRKRLVLIVEKLGNVKIDTVYKLQGGKHA